MKWSVRLALVLALLATPAARAYDQPVGGVVVEQDARCGPEDLPETGVQGDVPRADQESGRAEQGYNCGLALVGHTALGAGGRPATGNANMAWSGHCAYVSGSGALFGDPDPEPGAGVAVVDVRDPARPRHVTTLRTPGATAAMETLHAVTTARRAVLVVGQYGNRPSSEANPMDVYDVSNCARPRLLQTFEWPENIHNLTLSGNGRYVFATQPLQVVDLEPLFDTNPRTGAVYVGNLEAEAPGLPLSPGPTADVDDPIQSSLPTHSEYLSHEAWPTHDGTKVYVGGQIPTWETLSIFDIADWLRGKGAPKIVSQKAGRGHSVRTATIGGTPFLLHSEESVFGPTAACVPETLNPVAGPAQPWLTDLSDEREPTQVSQFGLAINEPEHCPDALASNVRTGVHYHDVDDPTDTTFVAASFWHAGVRVFDVRDPAKPVEVAYFNPGDVDPGDEVDLDRAWGHVRYVKETGHLWFATSSGGFWVVELEPQVRRQLGFEPVTTRHPKGRPARAGIALQAGAPIDVSGWYCTLQP